MTATPELAAMLQRAQQILEQMISRGDSGTVTIGYGNKGLRLVVNLHERSVPIKSDNGTLIAREK